MGVKLRKRKNSDGSTSLLLDIFHNGERRREFLTNLKLTKPASPADRTKNRENLAIAEQIRIKTAQQLDADEYQVAPAFRKGIDFVQFFEKYLAKYPKKDKRVVSACFSKFKEFMEEEGITILTTKKLNATLVVQFKEYLELNLKGETPANYMKKFKKVLRHGIKERIFTSEISTLLSSKDNDLMVKTISGIKKEILTFEEIQTLASTTLTNTEVKRAFLFSCMTGLRFCDIKVLQWRNIQSGVLKITQQKTNHPAIIPLNESSLKILGKRGKGENLVFTLPSSTACAKNLKHWCNKAKIDKHITWHCARHSFGVAIITYGADVKNASSLLAHKSLTYTDRYLRESEKLKEKAVQNLPEVNLK